jgi:hypothetical protein
MDWRLARDRGPLIVAAAQSSDRLRNTTGSTVCVRGIDTNPSASATSGRPEGQPVNHGSNSPSHQPQDPIDDGQWPRYDQ